MGIASCTQLSTAGRACRAAALLGVVLLAYSPALRAGFVWDDDMYVVNNELLTSWQGLARIWTRSLGLESFDSGGGFSADESRANAPRAADRAKFIDYPLSLTSYWLDWQLWRLNPLPYHLVNILLHGVNSILLWLILERLRLPGSFVAAVIFAVHPLHVESVAWVSERKTVLSTAFAFAATLWWLDYLTTYSRKTLLLALCAGILAMLSKVAATVLPGIFLLLGWWRTPDRWRELVARVSPLVVAAAVLLAASLWRERAGQAYVPEQAGLVSKLLIAGHAAWFYIGKLLWPVPLLPIYPRLTAATDEIFPYVYPSTLVLALVVLWSLRGSLGRAPFAAAGVYLVTIAPSLGLVRFGYLRLSDVADHFAYPATAAVIAAVSCAALSDGGRVRQRVKYLLAASLCLVCTALTAQQCFAYKNGLSFWSHASRYNPESNVASVNLASLLVSSGRGPEAEEVARAALTRFPSNAPLHNLLGASLGIQNTLGAAEAEFRQALGLWPDFADARLNLGITLFRQQRWEEAIRELRLLPERDARAKRHIGLAYRALGDRAQALEHLETALRIDPNDATARKAIDEMQSDAAARKPDAAN